MLQSGLQTIKDAQGKSIGVFLLISEYERIMDRIEELEDIKDYDFAKEKNEEKVLLRDAIKIRKNKYDILVVEIIKVAHRKDIY